MVSLSLVREYVLYYGTVVPSDPYHHDTRVSLTSNLLAYHIGGRDDGGMPNGGRCARSPLAYTSLGLLGVTSISAARASFTVLNAEAATFDDAMCRMQGYSVRG